MLVQRVICLIIGYLFGLIQTGFIIGKINHIDIRDFGSGNSGTTNTFRVLGKKAGIITYLVDALKVIGSAIVVYLLFNKSCSDIMFVLVLYSGLGVILGHNFPFYMNFKGGKGIAASSGVFLSLALYDWKFVVMALITFGVALYITKYVSVGSLCILTGFFIEIVVWGQLGMVRGLNAENRVEAYIIVGIMMILAYVRHKENIKRIIDGTERKIGQKKEQ